MGYELELIHRAGRSDVDSAAILARRWQAAREQLADALRLRAAQAGQDWIASQLRVTEARLRLRDVGEQLASLEEVRVSYWTSAG